MVSLFPLTNKMIQPATSSAAQPDGLTQGLGSGDGSVIQDFRNKVMGQFVDYFPKPGETCEYQREVGEWIPCEIIREYRREPTQYLARYVSHTGQLKTGIVGACNLRPSSPNDRHQPRET